MLLRNHGVSWDRSVVRGPLLWCRGCWLISRACSCWRPCGPFLFPAAVRPAAPLACCRPAPPLCRAWVSSRPPGRLRLPGFPASPRSPSPSGGNLLRAGGYLILVIYIYNQAWLAWAPKVAERRFSVPLLTQKNNSLFTKEMHSDISRT